MVAFLAIGVLDLFRISCLEFRVFWTPGQRRKVPVDGSGKIQVCKSDSTEEAFDVRKLAASMFSAMQETRGRYYDASQLAIAIGIYLERTSWLTVTSDALAELAIKVLNRCRLSEAGSAMADYREKRAIGRSKLQVRHEGGAVTLWDKAWLSSWTRRSWLVSRNASRILAGQVERVLLESGTSEVSRLDVLDILNRRVAEYGLADAVPVRQPATM